MNIKKSVRNLLSKKQINPLATSAAKAIGKLLPQNVSKAFHRIPVNRAFTSEFDGRNIKFVGNGKDTIATQVFWEGVEAYEKEAVNLTNFLSKNVRSFFDIGANIGIYSLIATSVGSKISVHSFEPLDSAFGRLKENKEVNNYTNMIVNPAAVSSFDGESILHITKGDDDLIPLGASLGEVVTKNSFYEELKVPTVKLDTYMQTCGLETVDFMKVDTEGTEPQVFAGAEKTLEKSRPLIICEVLHNLIENDLHRIFDSKSYSYYLISNRESQDYKLKKCEKIIGDNEIVSNYLLVPTEKISIVESYINT